MKRFLFLALTAVFIVTAKAADVDSINVSGSNLPDPMKVVVITPENLNDTVRYPVAYVLHGYGGAQDNWIKHQPRLKDLADQYGMIIVNPDGRNSWYIDSPVDSTIRMESFFIEDLIPYIDANYPTNPEPSQRAVTGLSMGGHGALSLAFKHPDVFGNAGSMSGGVDILPFAGRWTLNDVLGSYDEHPERWEAVSVINLVDNVKPGTLNILIDCGNDDFFKQVNDNLHQVLIDKGIAHDYISRPGGHSWDYWNNSILYHLLFFNEAFKKAPVLNR